MAGPAQRFVRIDSANALHVLHAAPTAPDAATFVFLNSMGATTAAWETRIAPTLRQRGFGTLSFDYRGQGESRYGADATLTPAEIIADIGRVMTAESPLRPIFVGLSIGGLFGAWAQRGGARALGIVLINTLRKPNAQVEWINTLEARLIAIGGMPLVLDVLRPVLSGREELARLRPTHLPADGYAAWPPEHPRRRLAEGVHEADWAFPWESLGMPALVLTGLHDRLFRIQEDVDEIVARIPDAEVVTFPDGGHALQAEHPDRFIALAAGFARRVIATAASA